MIDYMQYERVFDTWAEALEMAYFAATVTEIKHRVRRSWGGWTVSMKTAS